MEWMWLADMDKVPYNEEYYVHCFEILEKTIIKELGQPAESVQSVWNSYMFYPFEQSRAYNILRDKKLLTRST